MIIRRIPIFFVNKICVTVKIKLIHSKYDREIFWLPLFFIGIAVFHAHLFHNIATSRIVFVMCCCNIDGGTSKTGTKSPLMISVNGIIRNSLDSLCSFRPKQVLNPIMIAAVSSISKISVPIVNAPHLMKLKLNKITARWPVKAMA